VLTGKYGRYWKGEYRYRKANGEYAYIFDQGYLLVDQKGEPTRFVGAMQDISARKEIENEKELIIEELTNSNNDLKQFSFITSHNLRAPLSNIQGILNLIDAPALSDTNRQMFEFLQTSTTQLQQTIKDLSDIIVIRDKPVIHSEELNLVTLFNNVKKNFLNTLHEIPHELKTDFQLEKAFLNKSYIESIFINLVSNAIKYRSNDRALKINVSTRQAGASNLVITFTDNGIGLDYERCKNRVFGMYQRFHENIEGRGLGLFMVKSQVTSMGGTINLESELDKGTRFTIELPLKSVKGVSEYRD
jgi:signal transduction histidine kinase